MVASARLLPVLPPSGLQFIGTGSVRLWPESDFATAAPVLLLPLDSARILVAELPPLPLLLLVLLLLPVLLVLLPELLPPDSGRVLTPADSGRLWWSVSTRDGVGVKPVRSLSR